MTRPPAAAARPAGGEAALAARWADGLRGLRLEDGRALAVVFPGVPAGAGGPDFRDAIVEAGGDLLRGDVEVHLLASGWRTHGHHRDPAYAGVVLHVVGANDTGALATIGPGGRPIALAVLPPPPAAGEVRPFVPPCALAAAHGSAPGPTLIRLGGRRLRAKAARAALLVDSAGEGQGLYLLLLEALADPANRAAFAAIGRRLPLAALLEAAEGMPDRALAVTAALRGAAAALTLRRVGLRPLASPGRRLEAAGALIARFWPAGASPGWPPALAPGCGPAVFRTPGVGRALALELMVNALLPAAAASGRWPAPAVAAAYAALPSPGTYGRLRALERWLGSGAERPFTGAAALQGGLLLHGDYCARGRCGRCPLS
ncbi:MAG: DUF2851 family protein [Dehalococcoidia bacterium]|nr:DUF2851 family protein [Dehalococcoidia bacterium]